MKIALINENSQNSKNPMIEAALKKVVEPMGHTVFNYGMVRITPPPTPRSTMPLPRAPETSSFPA